MGRMQPTDEIDRLLYEHMSGVEEKYIHSVPDNDDIDYQFSEEFERKMQTMIKRERLKRKYGVPVKTWKRVAAMFIIVMSGILVPTMSVDAVREKVFSYIRNFYETYTSTQYFVQEDKEEFVPMYPSYVPEGYELVLEDSGDDYLVLSYEQKDKDSLIIQQEIIRDKMIVHTNNEFEGQETCEVHEETAVINYSEDGIITLSWDKGQYRYMLTVTNMTKNEVIKVAESLK